MTHRWGQPIRNDHHSTRRVCLKGCGTVKVSRKEPPEYWTEFWRDGERVAVGRVPQCATPDQEAEVA